MPGHPSDIPSSRSSGGSTGSSVSGPPGDHNQYYQPPSPHGPSGNTQTRNIIIGAIATVIASTSVYYLTQYINNKKTDSIPNPIVMKEATTNAWKRYVTMDNIYYKSTVLLANDESVANDPYKRVAEITKEADIFKRDAEEIAKEKNVDPALKTMLTRRVERQTEYIDLVNAFMTNAKNILASKTDEATQKKKLLEAFAPVLSSINLLYKKAATEIEELSKTLSATYAITFDPNEVLIYAAYKKGVSDPGLTNGPPNPADFSTHINSKDLIGNWADKDDKISLQKNGSMNSSNPKLGESTGTWKIENDRLRIDAEDKLTKIKYTLIFGLQDITPNSFTMVLTTTPFEVYHAVRQKEN